jgi:hypothetical protein
MIYDKRSKKADISVTLLVVMTLLLCIASLIIFLTQQNSVESKIVNVGIVSDAYAKETSFEYYLYNVAKLSSKEVFSGDNLAKEDDVLKNLFLDNFQNKYLVNPKIPSEYSDSYYRDYIKTNSNYVLVLDRTSKTFKITFKNFEFTSRPGLENNQEVGLIKIKKDIVLVISY